MLSGALSLALLAVQADAGQQPPAGATGVRAEPADVVWRYDTGG
jgi:hypothetical protein